jgi:serine/threonine protein kinase/tetratricopeptide (TPR) repeat protein
MASADRLIDVFNEAKARLTEAERQRFVAEACADDPELKQQVLSLLQAHEGAAKFLQPAPLFFSTVLITEKPGDRIGRYKLLQKIGEGGCGVVYMAEQEEPVRRRVALKVIKLGMDTKSVIARFEAERQALALMDHPNIAKVFDAGATDTGRPYFVMELVRGVKITDYCDQNNLSTEERLKLFTQVCQAIQHAHQKGIIHRDIKPSNILVTISEPGSPGSPKVIDFGITTGQRLTDKTVFTAFEQFIGTPAYMSPEQAMMTSLDVDTRTDIYALGVLLYELLTGQTPFDTKDLMAAGLDAMRHIIREQEPARPSTRVSTLLAADLTIVASHRHAEPGRLGTLLRGDLDWIVMKALEKDRARRYDTANDLATDIQRHLTNEPVAARPPSTSYRFQKLVRRNKLAFGAVAAVTMALVLGVVASSWQALRATRAESAQSRLRKEAEEARGRAEVNQQKAISEAAKSQQVAKVLQDMLASAAPQVAMGRDTTLLREVLDRTVTRLGNDLQAQPEVEIELLRIISLTYASLGENKEAVGTAAKALQLHQSITPVPTTNTASFHHHLARQLRGAGDLKGAEDHFRQALAINEKLLGPASVEVFWGNLDLALLYSDRKELGESEQYLRIAETNALKRWGDDVIDSSQPRKGMEFGIIHLHLGMLDQKAKQWDAATTQVEKGLAHLLESLGETNTDYIVWLGSYERLLRAKGDLNGAGKATRRALTLAKSVFGNDHPRVAELYRDLAEQQMSESDLPAAIESAKEALRIFEKARGQKDDDSLKARQLLTDLEKRSKL